jgi:uncharacterized membrane protein YhaH (DUF805 family)
MTMPFPFRFTGKISRLPYALWSLGLFFSQFVVLAVTFRALDQPLDPSWMLSPYRPLFPLDHAPAPLMFVALAYLLLVAWALAALSFRRAADAGVNEWITAYVIAPLLQIGVIGFLCIARTRSEADAAMKDAEVAEAHSRWIPVTQGVIAGVALTLLAVAVSALVFGAYGFGIFVAAPFIVGATTGYFIGRNRDIDVSESFKIVALAVVLGGVALAITALEGIVCLILAAPLAIVAAAVGSLFGRAIALTGAPPSRTLSGVAVLPIIFALEAALPPVTHFATEETMTIAAPPAAVWDSLVHMRPIDAPLALQFRLGMAYPISGDIAGEGVGAVRRGEFSTGTAIERVTEWEAGRKLAFIVETDVPSMRELSPYEHVHAPHVIGYFFTTLTSFELVPLADARTEVVEHTAHQLRLDPVFYWLPLARWIVHENNTRVLEHIKRQAEGS